MSDKTIKKERAWELDFLRGIAVILMISMHASYDLGYEFGIHAFRYINTQWYMCFVHPFVVGLFVGISGICCTLTRNNWRRCLKLFIVTVVFYLGTILAHLITGICCQIYFNVLAVLTIGIFVYAVISAIEKATKAKPEVVSLIMGLVGIYIVICACDIHEREYYPKKLALLPFIFDLYSPEAPDMADYMPLLPWLGVFLIGCVIGRACYKEKKTLFANRGKVAKAITRPFEFVGRHALVIYLVHQPVIYGIMLLIYMLICKVR